MTKKIGKQLGLLLAHFSPKLSDKNFEIAILFILVEKPNNYAFGYNMTLTAQGERSSSYKIGPLFTNNICNWKVCIHFRVGGGQISFWEFFQGEFSMEREVFRR